MAIVGMQGHQVNEQKTRFAVAAEAITLPEANVALWVVYDATAYGHVRLPDADGENPAGFMYGKNAASGDEITIATGELAYMVAAEAITIGQELMVDNATGHCLVAAGSGAYKVGRALTAQANVGGFLLVEVAIGGARIA